MVNIFALQTSMTEAATGFGVNQIRPYEFIGELSESTFGEASTIVMTEAAAIAELNVRGDEMLTEAVMSGNMYDAGVLAESIFDTIFNKIKELWNKFVSTIKGLIEKLKAFALRMSGQTTKWANAMEKKILEAAKLSGSGSASAEMYEWKTAAFDKLVISGQDDVKYEYDVATKITELASLAETVKATSNDTNTRIITNGNIQYSGADNDKDRDDVAAKVTNNVGQQVIGTGKIGDYASRIEDELDKHLENLYKDYSTKYGVSAQDSETDLLKEIKDEVYGSKTSVTYGNQVRSMLAFVKDASKKISATEKAYKYRLDIINKEIKAINDAEKAFNNMKTGKENEALVNGVSSVISKLFTRLSTVKTSEQKLVNAIKSLSTKAVQDRAADYMRVLTKFANTKKFD